METLLAPQASKTVPPNEPPGFIDQAAENGWRADYFSFGKAEHPHCDYFNCAVHERPDGLWLMTRRSVWEDRLRFGFNDVVAFRLGGEYGLVPQIGYKVKFPMQAPKEQTEDPRAIYHAGRTWLSVCDFQWFRTKKWTGAHQLLLPLDDKWNALRRIDVPYGTNGKGLGLNTKSEKNWLWFVRDNKFHLVYQAKPHTVVEFDDSFTKWTERRSDVEFRWEYGEIRGGTPPVLVNNEYITFFHSSLPWNTRYRRYFLGAYGFEAKPPFAMTRITKEPLLIGSQNDYWVETKPLVIFATGAILRGQNWLVSFGVNDLKSGWCEIPHKDLCKRLVWLAE